MMIRRLVRSLRASKVYFEAVWQMDSLFTRIVASNSTVMGTDHVLLAATGGGNIGDQAMFESFLQNVDGRVVVVVSDKSSLVVPEVDASRVEIVEIPGLVTGLPLVRLRGTRKLLAQLKSAKSYSVIGADIMDGVYSPEQSIARLSTVNCALLLGVNARILGFSWSPSARPSAKEAMRRLNGRAAIFARDPRSQQRLKNDGVTDAAIAADIVFSHSSEAPMSELSGWVQKRKNEGQKIAVLNISGLISSKIKLDDDYRKICDHLTKLGYSIIMLPHVVRDGDDDLSAIHEYLLNASVAEGPYIVNELLTPSQVKSLVGTVDCVITGRMHLAVLALSAKVPTITLGTQGKVEGLYAMFDLEDLCVQPASGMSAKCLPIISTFASNSTQMLQRIESKLPEIKRLSKLNFDGISVRQLSKTNSTT